MSLLELFRKAEMIEGQNEKISEVPECQANPPSDFNSKISECVRASLEKFGGGVPQIVLFNLKGLYGMEPKEITRKPEEFEKCLDQIFRAGSGFVKNAIRTEINGAFGLKQEYSSLKDCLDAARMLN